MAGITGNFGKLHFARNVAPTGSRLYRGPAARLAVFGRSPIANRRYRGAARAQNENCWNSNGDTGQEKLCLHFSVYPTSEKFPRGLRTYWTIAVQRKRARSSVCGSARLVLNYNFHFFRSIVAGWVGQRRSNHKNS
jgi:hypothetical protein